MWWYNCTNRVVPHICMRKQLGTISKNVPRNVARTKQKLEEMTTFPSPIGPPINCV